MPKSLMILGGSGFFGKTFLESYLQEKLTKYEITKLILVSRNNKVIQKISKNSKKKIIILKKDLSIIKNIPFADYIIYAAEYVNSLKIIRNYKKGLDLKTFDNVFKILSSKKFAKSKLIYISSGSVYSERNSFPKKKLHEKSKIYPRKFEKLKTSHDIYVNNKIIGEQMIRNLSRDHGMKTSIARSFALVGQHLPLNAQYVLGNFIFSILKKKPVKIFEKSSKSIFRSFMHTDDLVSWLMIIVKNSKLSCPIYNVGSDQPISIWSLAKYISKTYNLKFIYPKQKNKNFDYYIPSTKKAQKELDLIIKFDLKKSLNYTLETLNL
jgi:nucleoside-diphosphate-sugar epimerase